VESGLCLDYYEGQGCKEALAPAFLRLCLKTRSGFERLVFRLTASGSIDDKTNIACFAVFARRKTARSRADDGVFRKSLCSL
jgi:streptomycin 6-kinase